MKIKKVIQALEKLAPSALAESYDNVGLLVGDPNWECKGILINLDCTEAVVDEAIEQGLNLIVVHHPIWFSGRKRLNGEDYVSRVIIKAVKHDIGIYAIHTNLDNVRVGVNDMICEKLGLEGRRILAPKSQTLQKLVTYVPEKDAEAVLLAIFEAGAGKIGDYDQSAFTQSGTGSFRPLKGSNPTIGQQGEREFVNETRIEAVFPFYAKGKVISALKQAHPYEEVAYQIMATANSIREIGSGMIGTLPEAMDKQSFLEKVKSSFHCGGIRFADAPKDSIQKVAVCGGAGSFLIQIARRSGADAFITGDITYHKFFDNEEEMLLLDIGHYESEQFTSQLIYNYISKVFPNFAILLSEVYTNPVKYF